MQSASALHSKKHWSLEKELHLSCTREFQPASSLSWGSSWKVNSMFIPTTCIFFPEFIIRQKLRFRHKQLGIHATDIQTTKWTNDSTNLMRKIRSFIQMEHLYIPSLILAREKEAENTPDDQEVYEIPLMLPSSLSPRTHCDPHLLNIEFYLRFAQCNESLNSLRNELCAQAFVLIDKRRFQRGQKANTRSQTVIDGILANITRAATRYRIARAALSSLATRLNKSGWDRDFLPLQDGDIRPLVVEDITEKATQKEIRDRLNRKSGQPEGRRKVSWIWLKNASNPDIIENDETSRVRLHESTLFLMQAILFIENFCSLLYRS